MTKKVVYSNDGTFDYFSLRSRQWSNLGNLSNHDGGDAISNTIALLLILLNVWNFGEFFLELNSKEPYLSSENEKKLVVLSLCPP